MLRLLPDAVLSLIYPQDCTVCDREVTSARDGVACSDCWDKTRIFEGSETLCIKCGAFLFGPRTLEESARCRRCEDQHFDHAFAVGIYEHALKASVLSLKKVPRVPPRVKQFIAGVVERLAIDDYIVVPVPLSPRRLRQRGFNQAEIIARITSKALGAAPESHTLVRDVETQVHRAGMDRKARESTVKNVFTVARPRRVEGKNVLLIDDVLTSGSTASACSEILKRSGAATVDVLTIARTA